MDPTSDVAQDTVTITGTNLWGATVRFGATPGTDVHVNNTGTQLTVNRPVQNPTPTAPVDVTVSTPGPTGDQTVTAGQFTYMGDGGSGAPGGPTVTSMDPTTGPVGTSIKLTGTNLANATAVTVGGIAVNPSTNNATTIELIAPAHADGPATVVVTTAAGTVSAGTFTYTGGPTPPPPPAVTSMSPAIGPAGTRITVSGTGLANATAVTVGGIAVTPYTDTATSIQFPAPPHTAGDASVVVTTATGTASAGTFTYTAVAGGATVASITPADGNPGDVVLLNGDFTGVVTATVTFGGQAGTVLSGSTTSALRVRVPTGTPGAVVDVVLTTKKCIVLCNPVTVYAGQFHYKLAGTAAHKSDRGHARSTAAHPTHPVARVRHDG
jgi:hypothetical protein